MNLPKLIEQFGSEDRCRSYLEELRWPDGVALPTLWRLTRFLASRRRSKWECNEESCRYQFSVTAGTVFHDSHLPLWKWFLAIYLIGESKKGISAKQLQRTLGRLLQDGLVPGAPHPLGDGGGLAVCPW